MKDIIGRCVCGAVEIVIKEYGNFVYACHCDTCRRMNSGPVLSVDPGPKENIESVGVCFVVDLPAAQRRAGDKESGSGEFFVCHVYLK